MPSLALTCRLELLLLSTHHWSVQAGLSLAGPRPQGLWAADAECPVPLMCRLTKHHLSYSVTFAASDSAFQAGFGSIFFTLQLRKLRAELRGKERGSALNTRWVPRRGFAWTGSVCAGF